MHIVAIYELKEDKLSMAGDLARALEAAESEALMRLRAQGNGPFIVRLFAEHEQADRLASRLKSVGFHTVVLSPVDIEAETRRLIVKKFSLGEQHLHARLKDGSDITAAYRDIELILRGAKIASRTEIETTKQRSLSLGRAVLTGGIVLTKTEKIVNETTTAEREGFLSLYSGNKTIIYFLENALAYDSLGSAMKPSRSANFAYLAAELRSRCPHAPYDDRLLNKAGITMLLGPMLNPETHLDVATALLSKTLRGARI